MVINTDPFPALSLGPSIGDYSESDTEQESNTPPITTESESDSLNSLLAPLPSSPKSQGALDADSTCAICIMPFDASHPAVQTACGHVFGKACMISWL